jgi:hypothetical protein
MWWWATWKLGEVQVMMENQSWKMICHLEGGLDLGKEGLTLKTTLRFLEGDLLTMEVNLSGVSDEQSKAQSQQVQDLYRAGPEHLT